MAGSQPRRRLGALLVWAGLCAVTLAAYFPVLRGGFLWDDAGHVTRPDLRSLHGLWRIWFQLGATQQYYPLLHSAFWVEHRLWGDSVLGYHLVNVLLHATVAFLFGVVLCRLAALRPAQGHAPVRGAGAWAAALIFAVHPVCVESVAWISEQKNTLSAVFYLLALVAYMRWEAGGWRLEGRQLQPPSTSHLRPPALYLISFALFVAAVLSKSVTATLPGALLVIFWWQRGKLSWRRDAVPLLPFFAVGIASGLFTAWVERTYGGAEGAPYALGAVQRGLLAGRVVWFYLAKIFWPANLTFIYPRWEVSAAAAWQYVFSIGLIALLAVLWRWRKRTRSPLAGALFFIGTLFPALGFFNVYPFLYSYVADHFQYLAMMGIVAVTVGGGAALFKGTGNRKTLNRKIGKVGKIKAAESKSAASALPDLPDLPVQCLSSSVFQWLVVLVACVLAVLTFRDCGSYGDAETLYRATIAKNSQCWMAHTNLGVLLAGRGRLDEAIGHYRAALAIDPSLPNTRNDLGSALFAQGKVPAAKSEFEAALRLRPAYAEAIYNLGIALQEEGRTGEAIAAFYRALRLKPDFFEARYNLALTLGGIGRLPEALPQFETAVRLRPGFAAAHHNLGVALRAAGRLTEAEAELARARELGFSP